MPTPRVLVVGIDGVRLDLLPMLETPNLDELTDAGVLAPVHIDDDTPTMSGPCWTTIVTGVGVAKHGVWGNNFSGNRLGVFPDFTTRLATEQGLRTFAAGGWEPCSWRDRAARSSRPRADSPTSPRARTPRGPGRSATRA